MSDKQDMLDRLMQSLSSIDDDLLLDVEPARRRNIISIPHDRVAEDGDVERIPHISPDRNRSEGRSGRKRTPPRKVWVSLASVAAALVVVIGGLYVLNFSRKVSAPENAKEGDAAEQWVPQAPCDHVDAVVSIDGDILQSPGIEVEIEALHNTQSGGKSMSNDRGHDLSREVMRVADQTAYQMLAESQVNTLYSPFSIFQTLAFLAESAEGNSQFKNILDRQSNDLASLSFPYQLSEDMVVVQNAVLMSETLYGQCDQQLLGSVCKDYYFDIYTWKNTADASGGDADAAPIAVPYATHTILWNPLDELLLMFRYQAEVAWIPSVSSVDPGQGLFHASHQTFTGVPYYDSDDASLRHFALEGAVACEIPVQGGNLYLVLPDEGWTPDDLLSQDRFFTKLLTAEPAGENAVARFPELSLRGQRNLVALTGIRELRELAETPLLLRWLMGDGVTFPLIGQDIDFSLDGPVRKPDEYGPDAIDRMSLEAVFDRPFIFCLTENTFNTPILIGVYRYPD